MTAKMNSNPRPLASLSANLLARKGQARPAMRPQGFAGLTPVGRDEDLGWNDMGDDALYPDLGTSGPHMVAPGMLRQAEPSEPKLPVLTDEPLAGALPGARAAQIAREVAARTTRAAFTLRLDQQRHLRLRLAAAVTRRSAQQLVCEALDQFLDSLTEAEAQARPAASANAQA